MACRRFSYRIMKIRWHDDLTLYSKDCILLVLLKGERFEVSAASVGVPLVTEAVTAS